MVNYWRNNTCLNIRKWEISSKSDGATMKCRPTKYSIHPYYIIHSWQNEVKRNLDIFKLFVPDCTFILPFTEYQIKAGKPDNTLFVMINKQAFMDMCYKNIHNT